VGGGAIVLIAPPQIYPLRQRCTEDTEMAERETAAATGRAHLYDTGGAGVKMKEESATSAEECVLVIGAEMTGLIFCFSERKPNAYSRVLQRGDGISVPSAYVSAPFTMPRRYRESSVCPFVCPMAQMP